MDPQLAQNEALAFYFWDSYRKGKTSLNTRDMNIRGVDFHCESMEVEVGKDDPKWPQ